MSDKQLISVDILSSSLEDTEAFGRLVGSMCGAGDIVCLGGDLGAGKTTLAQAIARGAGVAGDEYVTSPTFAIMHEYHGTIPLYHMDFYRLGSADEVIELGLDEYFFGDGLSLVEWFELADDIIPDSRLSIHLSFIGESARQIHLSSNDKRWQELLQTAFSRLTT